MIATAEKTAYQISFHSGYIHTMVPSECIFSKAGEIVSKWQASFKPGTVSVHTGFS